MAVINLRDYYTFCQCDVLVDVPDDLAKQLDQWARDEESYDRKTRRNKAQYSLDYGEA